MCNSRTPDLELAKSLLRESRSYSLRSVPWCVDVAARGGKIPARGLAAPSHAPSILMTGPARNNRQKDRARWPPRHRARAGRPPRWTWPAPLASGVWPIRLSKCALTCHKSGRSIWCRRTRPADTMRHTLTRHAHVDQQRVTCRYSWIKINPVLAGRPALDSRTAIRERYRA